MEASHGGRTEEALAWLDEALLARPEGAEAHNGRGEILWDDAKIDEALIAQQLRSYPLSTCLISGSPIRKGKGINVLYGVQLTRFCCPLCPEAFAKEPQKYLAKLRVSRGD